MMDFLSQLALNASESPAVSLLAKSTIVLLTMLVLLALMRRGRASLHHSICASAFAVLLLLPVAAFILPSRAIAVSVAAETIRANEVFERTITSTADAEQAPHGGQATAGEWTYQDVLLLSWALGTVAFTLPLVVGIWQVLRIRRSASRWLAGQDIASQVGPARGVTRPVEVLVHAGITGPLTCGVWHPAIVFPADASTWNECAIRQALLHELEHIRRYDWVVHCVAQVTCAAYWFHPLVWIARRRMESSAEQTCDDAAISQGDPAGYASLLVEIARRQLAAAGHPSLGMANRRDLSVRVAAILSRRRRGRLGRTLVGIASIAAVVTVLALAPLTVVAQAPRVVLEQGGPSFTVISIKPNASGEQGGSSQFQPGGRYIGTNVTLRRVIGLAYLPLLGFQIVGGPAWINVDKFDIDARTGENTPPDALRSMLRTLLADRFKLTAHAETREFPAFNLVTTQPDGMLGTQLQRSTVDCPAAPGAAPAPSASGPGDGRPLCGFRMGDGVLDGRGVTIAALARELSLVGRIVVDRTELTGSFDVSLKWTPEAPAGAAPVDTVSIFTALQEQLGLRLDPATTMADVLVIDSAERPTAN